MVAKIDKTRVGTFTARAFYNLLKTTLEDDTIYAGVHYVPDSDWNAYAGSLDSESTFWGGVDSDFDNSDRVYYQQTMYSMHKIFPGGVSRVIPRSNWVYGKIYNSHPQSNSYVLVNSYESGFATLNVYLCLHSPTTASYYAPTGSSNEPIQLADGYVWKYMYSISNSQAIRFLNESWMPVPEKIYTSEYANITTDSTNYAQYVSQINAEKGTVYGVQLDSDLLHQQFTQDSDLRVRFVNNNYSIELVGRDISTNTPTQHFRLQFRYDSDSNHYYTSMIEPGKGYIGPVTVSYDSEAAAINGITANVAPGSGFGSNVPQELQANSIMISVRNFPDTESSVVYKGSLYNMISLHINPIDNVTNAVAQDEFYITCNYFTVQDAITWNIGDIFRPFYNDDGRRGMVVSMDGKTVYYITTVYGNEYDSFKANEVVSLVSGNKPNTIVSAFNRGITFNSSDILAVDYKETVVTRNEGQIESFNFVLTF